MTMQPSNNSFQEIIGNGVKYIIPKFQRDYSWDTEHWEELWSDIESLNKEKYHYMGYIVLQRKKDNEYSVIDGQQRLVTLSIIVLVALKKLDNLVEENKDQENNKKRIQIIQEKYIGFQHSVTLSVNNKLTLNRNNKSFFKNLSNNLRPSNARGITKTNKLLKNAFLFFDKQNYGKTGEEIAQQVENISTGMIFTKIIVEDDLNAYKVFETLNARGVQLSTPDLLKNYIFSVVSKDETITDDGLDDLDEIWSGIISNLGESQFTDFVRYHYNFQHSILTKKKLFSAIKRQLVNPEDGIKYLNSLDRFSPIYSSLLQPNDSWWAEQEEKGKAVYKDAKIYLEGLALFNIKQPLVVLMIAFDQFSAVEFVKVAKYLYILSIRYNVICHFSPNEQENIYNKMAMNIHNKTYKRASHLKNDPKLFGEIYPSDEQFKNSFEFHKMPSRRSAKKIRFLLAQIEFQLGNNITNYENTTLEHICPYNPEQNWHEYFGEGAKDVSDRLGNMILLEKDNLKRTCFPEKKFFYQQSSFKLAAKVSEFNEWNLQSVNQFQSWLAEQACKTWRVE